MSAPQFYLVADDIAFALDCDDVPFGAPVKSDGSPDWDCEISLLEDEVSHEWLDALSEVDYLKVKPFLQK